MAVLPDDAQRKLGPCHHKIVCLSVIRWYSVEMVVCPQTFSLSVATPITILVFLYQTLWQHFDRNEVVFEQHL